jgi:hypothetical protein
MLTLSDFMEWYKNQPQINPEMTEYYLSVKHRNLSEISKFVSKFPAFKVNSVCACMMERMYTAGLQ